MTIDRSHIIDELFHFSQEGNGLIIGKPGIGKSYSIAELTELMTTKDVPAVIIPIDKLPDATDETLEAEIESDGSWLDYLDKIKPSNNGKAVLFFDAFDAARDETLKRQVQVLIHKAISRLKKWNIIVSVRSYDAVKSPSLQKLFGGGSNNGGVSCRHFEISELTTNELESAFTSKPPLRTVYEEADIKFRGVLKIPFFLHLLEIVLEDASQSLMEEIKVVKSETELLDLFWNKKVTNAENSYKKEICLTDIALKLTQNRTLSCLKDEFLNNQDIFKELRSEDLIDEVGVNGRYVAFSHNILFDYIVGRLVIPSKPEEFLEFIVQDKSRPFFLRPSFIFHFTRLWYNYRDLFWDNYNYLGDQLDVNISLFRRLVLTSVIANEYESIDELDSILTSAETIQQLLQSIRFLPNRMIGARDIELLYHLSNRLEPRFLWDYTFVFELIFQNEDPKQMPHAEKCGLVSRRLLRYILAERKARPEHEQLLDRLGSTRGIEFVSKTFSTNKDESKALLRDVVDMLGTPNFEIRYFSSLSNDIEFFMNEDPEFTAEIYDRIFSHTESSDEKTNMGSSVTLSLISNRRQDFEMCYYRLSKHYPNFLKISPVIAITTGLKIVNRTVLNKKLQDSPFRSSTPYTIQIGEIPSQFLPDLSSIWHDNITFTDPIYLNQNIIDYFKHLAHENEQSILQVSMKAYISNAKVGYNWKKLIEFGNEYPNVLGDYLYQLALSPIILTSSETTYEIGLSIKSIYPSLTKNKQFKLEEIILGLGSDSEEKHNKYIERAINRLLNCIPRSLIQTDEALKIVTESATVENEPTFKSTWSSEPYTTDKWLEDKGVDFKNQENQKIQSEISKLETFNRQRLNDTPARDDFTELLSVATSLFGKTSSEKLNKDLEFSALKEIATFYSILTRDVSQLDDEDYVNAKKAIQFSLRYMSKYDEPSDTQSSPALGYSPTPRIEASSALMHLFAYEKNESVLEDIKEAVKDSNSVVRFNVLREISQLWIDRPEEYWKIVLERLENESDSMTLSTLISNIYRKDIINDKEKVTRACELAAIRIPEYGKRDSFIETFAGFLLYLLDKNQNSIAHQIIYSHIDETDFTHDLVFRLFDFIDPKFPHNDYASASTRPILIQLLKDIVSHHLEKLIQVDVNKLVEEDSLDRERLMLIDFIVQRIYFSLDINEGIRKEHEPQPSEKNKKAFYDRIKPALLEIVEASKEIGGGIMVAHTAHYLIETLNGVIKFYPNEGQSVLNMASTITQLSYQTGYTFDSSAIDEVVRLTEILFADHKELLRNDKCLDQLVSILNIYVESGWTQALELLWRLDEAFK